MLRGLQRGVAAVAALEDRLRRRIYLLIRRARRPLTREEVAGETGISRRLAAFHLDKLVERGLLRAHYARPPGRGGPGAGRTAKYYQPSDLEVEVSIPERRYDLVGHLLVRAVLSEGPGERAEEAALRAAREEGVEVGARVRRERGLGRLGPERALTTATEVLEGYGFEPYRQGADEVALGNCPFHALAREAPELVCRMNRAFVEGLLRGLGAEALEAVLEYRPGDCCVTLRRRPGG